MISTKSLDIFQLSCRQACEFWRVRLYMGINRTIFLSKPTVWSYTKALSSLGKMVNIRYCPIFTRRCSIRQTTLVCKLESGVWRCLARKHTALRKFRNDARLTQLCVYVPSQNASYVHVTSLTTLPGRVLLPLVFRRAHPHDDTCEF